MGMNLKNRKRNPYDQERPAYVDDRGRACVNPGLDGDVYTLFIPPGAAGANKVHFDFFNAESARDVEIIGVQPIVDGSVAVTGTLAVNLFLTRTSAVGTGGTAATAEGTALTAATISRLDPNSPALPSGITARAAPAGGATAGALLAFDSVFSEETNAAAYNRENLIKDGGLGTRIVITPNTGIRVVQGSVASVGNIGFLMLFTVIGK